MKKLIISLMAGLMFKMVGYCGIPTLGGPTLSATGGNVSGTFTGNGGGLTNLNGYTGFSLLDGTISNWYQTRVVIPPMLLATLDTYWSNNPNTSFFNPNYPGASDATAVLGSWTQPSVTITNAIVLAPGTNGSIYYEVPGLTGKTPPSYTCSKSLNWIFNGGSLIPQNSQTTLKFAAPPTVFWDGYISNILGSVNLNQSGQWIIYKYMVHNNSQLEDVWNVTGVNCELDNSIMLSGWDMLHGITVGIVKNSFLYSYNPGGTAASCVDIGTLGGGFFINNSIICASGAVNSNAPVRLRYNNSVGVVENSDIYSSTNINSVNSGQYTSNGTNSVILVPFALFSTNQVASDGFGVVVGSSTYTITNTVFVVGTTYTNNPITQTLVNGTLTLNNAAAGDAIITFTNLTKQSWQTIQMPSSLVSGTEQVPFSTSLAPGDICEFINSSTGSGATVSIIVYPTVIAP